MGGGARLVKFPSAAPPSKGRGLRGPAPGCNRRGGSFGGTTSFTQDSSDSKPTFRDFDDFGPSRPNCCGQRRQSTGFHVYRSTARLSYGPVAAGGFSLPAVDTDGTTMM